MPKFKQMAPVKATRRDPDTQDIVTIPGATYSVDAEGYLILRVPMSEPRPTESGKSLIVASLNTGYQDGPLTSGDGKELGTPRISLTVFVPVRQSAEAKAQQKKDRAIAKAEAQLAKLKAGR